MPVNVNASKCPGLLGYTSSGCPNRLCSNPPLLGFYWNWWGETALSQASMPTIYKQHLYNTTPYTLKYGPGFGKTLFPVLADNRTLRITRPDSPMRHIDMDRFLHDMALISHVTLKWFNMISNENVQSFRTYWNEPIIQHYSTASWTTFHIFDGLTC